MQVFYRSIFTELWLTLRSDEVLGILDSTYIEDYFGNDGQITLRLEDDTRIPVLVSEVVSETLSVPHDVFTGVIDVTSIPNGVVAVEARVRDVAGNYTIIGAVQSPTGNERVIALQFRIVPGTGVVFSFGVLKLIGGVTFSTPFRLSSVVASSMANQPFDTTLIRV